MAEVAKVFVADLQANQDVATTFVVADKQLRRARSGSPFLTLRLADRTGEIIGRVWERVLEQDAAIPGRVAVFVRGRCERFRDELQLHIQEIAPVAASEVNSADFLPVCPLSVAELWKRLLGLAESVKRRSLQRLLQRLLRDQALMERFKRAPAAKSMHHAYLGGLLEHTVSVAELVLRVADHYPELNRELLTAGAILHDIGKVSEFVYELHIDYSDEGRLLGHMVQGLHILEEKLAGCRNFPGEEALLLKHLILSHHGQWEYGAVRLPMTREAFVLHFADDLDAKMNALSRILRESGGEGAAWTAYQPLFERFFLRGTPIPAGRSADSATASGGGGESAVQLRVWPTADDPGAPTTQTGD
jgi:3'-5' exoribonuclease